MSAALKKGSPEIYFRNDKESDGQLLGLLQETGIISLIADWHILSDIIPETINMGDISAPYYLLISKVADCNVSWHLSA